MTTHKYFTNFKVKLLPDEETKSKIWELLKRDTRVINRILGIMNYDEKVIYSLNKSGKRYQTSRTILNELMITSKTRPNVKYDLKNEFPNISNNEIQECLDNANEMYLGYLNNKLLGKHTNKPYLRRLISRRIDRRRFEIDPQNHSIKTIYSCITNLKIWSGQQTRVLHDRIEMQYVPSKRADQHFKLGEVKSATIDRDKGKFYFNMSVEIEVPEYQPKMNADLAVIGVDLGISKTATAVLLTKNGILDTISLNDSIAKKSYIKTEIEIADLQREKMKRNSERYRKFFHYMVEKVEFSNLSQYLLHLNRQIKNKKITSKMVANALKLARSTKVNEKYQSRTIRVLEELQDVIHRDVLGKVKSIKRRIGSLKNKRRGTKDNMIKQLCSELSEFIKKHATAFDLYVVVGKPNGIQYRRGRRGSGNKWLRKKINQWAFYKFQIQLEHNMNKVGMGKRFIKVGEAWTSSFCYKCNTKGDRPRQKDFYCQNYNCLLQINADINGATNIAKRGILYMKLVDNDDFPDFNLETKVERTARKKKTQRNKNNRSKKIKIKDFQKNDRGKIEILSVIQSK